MGFFLIVSLAYCDGSTGIPSYKTCQLLFNMCLLAASGRIPQPQPLISCSCLRLQVSFLDLLGKALQDFTLIVLLASGALSVVLELALARDGENGWVEGASIFAAVAIVALVTAVNDFQKEKQFRELNALTQDTKVPFQLPLNRRPGMLDLARPSLLVAGQQVLGRHTRHIYATVSTRARKHTCLGLKAHKEGGKN